MFGSQKYMLMDDVRTALLAGAELTIHTGRHGFAVINDTRVRRDVAYRLMEELSLRPDRSQEIIRCSLQDRPSDV